MAEEANPTLEQVITANEQPPESAPTSEVKPEQAEPKVEEKPKEEENPKEEEKPKEEGTKKLEASQENKDLGKYKEF